MTKRKLLTLRMSQRTVRRDGDSPEHGSSEIEVAMTEHNAADLGSFEGVLELEPSSRERFLAQAATTTRSRHGHVVAARG